MIFKEASNLRCGWGKRRLGARQSARTLLILPPTASGDESAAFAVLGRRPPPRPPSLPGPARPYHGRAPCLVCRGGFRRGRDRRGAGIARERTPPPRLPDRSDRPGWNAARALPAHLAGIRLEEAAGGRRAADR